MFAFEFCLSPGDPLDLVVFTRAAVERNFTSPGDPQELGDFTTAAVERIFLSTGDPLEIADLRMASVGSKTAKFPNVRYPRFLGQNVFELWSDLQKSFFFLKKKKKNESWSYPIV